MTGIAAIHWLALCAGVGALLAWLAFRRPSALLGLVLATFAIGPQWVLAHSAPPGLLAWAMPAHMLLLVLALLANAARYGVRLDLVNWPLLAVLLLLCQSLLLADLDPAITPAALLEATLGFALPWCLVHVALRPGSRARYALLIALLPTLCVIAGAVLDWLGIHPLFAGSAGRGARLQGASNPGWLAFLAFAGFAIALHEAVRRRRFDFASLAALNLGIALMSGGRMGVIACAILAATYVLLAPGLRARLALLALIAVAGAGGVMALGPHAPLNELAQGPGLLDPNGRDRLWRGNLDAFLASPLFGRGLGAAEHGGYQDLPHNEYLRLLVDSGLLGAALYGTAVLLWAWRVLDLIRPRERPFAWAMFLALGAYAFTDNVLIMPAGMIPFLYLAIMRTPSLRRARRRRRRADRRFVAQPASTA
ncbi:MAG TPA: O-antigen ligase family protein [Geminicoccaceae bacterium]|nr:O-antigen ligase family protein [Geminicoccaceae bacterium]